MNYDVNYFIQKFEAIPEDRWCIQTRDDGEGRHCALGHINVDQYKHPEETALRHVLGDSGMNMIVVGINNGDNEKYQQPTPKQRILAALYDIKKLQEWEQEPKPSYHDITKQLAILPIEETTDKINTKILQS